MKAKLIFFLIGAALVGAWMALPLRGAVGGGGKQANPAVVSKLSEIVSIRERLAKDHEMLVGAGRAAADGAAEIELAEARIELALEKGEGVEVELKGLVAAHERRTKRLEALVSDRLAPGDPERARAGFLEAQVRLLRAQRTE